MILTLLLYLFVFFFSLYIFKEAVIWKYNNTIDEEKYNYKIGTVFSFIPLFLLLSLRDHVGTDYVEYANTFQSVANDSLTGANTFYRGTGFTIFEKLVSLFVGDNYYLFFAICAFISIYALFHAILKGSKDPVMSLYIYFCFCLYLGLMNQFRQGLAMTLVMVGISYLFENKRLQFIVFTLLASIMHPSAIVCLILLLLNEIPFSKRMISLYIIGCVVVLFGFPIVQKLLLYTSYGQTYLNWDLYNQSGVITTILNLIVRTCFLGAALWVKDEVTKNTPYARILYHMAFICLILQCGAVKLYILARLSTYFYISYIFLFPLMLPHIASKLNIEYRKLFKPLVLILFFLYFLIYYFSGSGATGGGYDIYKSILF